MMIRWRFNPKTSPGKHDKIFIRNFALYEGKTCSTSCQFVMQTGIFGSVFNNGANWVKHSLFYFNPHSLHICRRRCHQHKISCNQKKVCLTYKWIWILKPTGKILQKSMTCHPLFYIKKIENLNTITLMPRGG